MLPLTAALCATTIALSAQTTVTILPAKDTTLYENINGDLANGAGPSVFIGRVGITGGFGIRRTVMQYDIAAAVPAGARIIAAELDWFSAQSAAFLPIQTFAHRVTTDWNEGTSQAPGQGGAGGVALAGETTWLHTDFPNTFWNNPGGDFAATPSYTFDMPGIGAFLIPPAPGLVSDIQDMLDNPSNNFGWLFKTDEVQNTVARRLPSREALTFQPFLEITYLMPGQTGAFGDGTVVNGSPFDLSLVGSANSGTTVPIVYTNAPTNAPGATFFALALDPIGLTLQPGTTAYLPLAGFVAGPAFLTSATGDAAGLFSIPPVSPGFLVTMQAAVLDASPLGFALSNAGTMLTQ